MECRSRRKYSAKNGNIAKDLSKLVQPSKMRCRDFTQFVADAVSHAKHKCFRGRVAFPTLADAVSRQSTRATADVMRFQMREERRTQQYAWMFLPVAQ